MNALMILGLIVAVLGVGVSGLGAVIYREGLREKEAPQPYAIVCNAAGEHAYVRITGEVSDETFAMHSDAVREAAAYKQRIEQVDTKEYEAAQAAKEDARRKRDAGFKVCK